MVHTIPEMEMDNMMSLGLIVFIYSECWATMVQIHFFNSQVQVSSVKEQITSEHKNDTVLTSN